MSIRLTETAQKVCVFGVILVGDFLYSVRMRENADKNNSKYGYFSRSVSIDIKQKKEKIFPYKIHCKKKKFSMRDFFSKFVPADSVTFTEEILYKKLHFLCRDFCS